MKTSEVRPGEPMEVGGVYIGSGSFIGSAPAFDHIETAIRSWGRSFHIIRRSRCRRCSWKSDERENEWARIKASENAHIKAAHPGKGKSLDVVVEVSGHCIRCAGAVYTNAVERPLIDFERPDEPVHPLHDGINEGTERRPFKVGWITFTISGKRMNVLSPHCPNHPEQQLRPYEVRTVEVEGRPPSDYLPLEPWSWPS